MMSDSAFRIRTGRAVAAACVVLLWAWLPGGVVWAETVDEAWMHVQKLVGPIMLDQKVIEQTPSLYHTRHHLLHGETRVIRSWDYAPSSHQITLSIGNFGRPADDVVQFVLDDHISIEGGSPGGTVLEKNTLRLECDPHAPCITESYYMGKVIGKTASSFITLPGFTGVELAKALRRLQFLVMNEGKEPL